MSKRIFYNLTRDDHDAVIRCQVYSSFESDAKRTHPAVPYKDDMALFDT